MSWSRKHKINDFSLPVFSICLCWCLVKMGNASETFLLVSRISKDNDFLMGTIYIIFGKWCVFFPPDLKTLYVWMCVQIQQPYYIPPLCLLGVLSVLGNGILLFVAYRKKSSLKPAEFFVVNLAISDLGMTISLFPLAIPSAFTHMWVAIQFPLLFLLSSIMSLWHLHSQSFPEGRVKKVKRLTRSER